MLTSNDVMRPLLARSSLVLASATFLVLMILLYGAGTNRLSPVFTKGAYRLSNQSTWIPFEAPLAYESEDMVVEAAIGLRLQESHASLFRLSADDCLKKLWVNNTELLTPDLPSCDPAKGIILRLGPLLRTGDNEIRVSLHNRGGPGTWDIAVAQTDPALLGLRVLLCLAIILTSLALAVLLRITGWNALLWAGLTSGIVLRLIYLFITPHDLRGHDAEGHIEYVRFLVEHLHIPGTTEGWEFYHPPLYYILSALWVGIGQAMGRSLSLLMLDLQWHALFLSIGSLLLGVWMARMIFPRPEERFPRALFVCLLAVFPGLVFFAARINNDVLLAFLEFSAFALLLHWWRKGDGGSWIALVLVIALAMLTKSNAILLTPIAFACLLMRRGWTHREKVITGIMSLFIILTATTWNFTLRTGAENGQPIIQNVTNLNGALRLNNSLEIFTEFNPLRVALHPYNNPWEDSSGRQNFWEYLFKSAFFGEFDFGKTLMPVASGILALALLLLPVLFFGAWRMLRHAWRASLPLWFSSLALLSGHVALRYTTPFSTVQDFRYSILLLVPLIAFTATGLHSLRGLLRLVMTGIFLLLVLMCILFLGALPWN